MFSLHLLFVLLANIVVSPETLSNTMVRIGKVYSLSEIFNVQEKIVFSDLCTVASKRGMPDNLGFQNVTSHIYPDIYYFDQERHYKTDDAQLMVKFIFSEPSPKLSRQVWEKYLLQTSIFASENMFIILRVKYKDEDYINAKRLSHTPLKYEQYSIVEMTDIDFNYERTTSCTLLDAENVINVECNFKGELLNEKGNRSIQLEGIRFKFQVLAAVSTERIYLGKINHAFEAFRTIGNEIPGADYNIRSFKVGERPEPSYKLPKYPCFSIRNVPFACYSHMDTTIMFKLASYDQEAALKIEGSALIEFPGDTMMTGQWIQIPHRQSQHWEKFAYGAAANVRF